MEKKISSSFPWLFFAITFAWSWGLNLFKVLDTAGIFTLPGWLFATAGYLAVFGPFVAAFALTSREEGKQGAGRLWKRGWDFSFDKTWLIPAGLFFPLHGLVSLGILRLMGEKIHWEYGLPVAMLVPIFLLIFFLNALPEEYGWRGYALGRLLSKWNPLTASLILGFIWALWHLPLHFIRGTVQENIPIWEYGLQTIVMTILYTWLYQKTKGSVFIAMLLHATGNITAAAIPTRVTTSGQWVSFGLLLIFVLILTIFTDFNKNNVNSG